MSVRALLVLVSLAGSVVAADVQTLSGKKLTGEIVGLDKHALILKSSDGEIRHPVSDVLLITLATGNQPPPGPFADIELVDGSVLHCTKLALKPQAVEVTVAPDMALTLPYSAISTICVDAHDPKLKAEFQQFAGKRGRFDIVAIRSEGRLNALEGTFGSGIATGDGIEFTLAGSEQRTTPKLNRIAGLVFISKPNTAAPARICKVIDGDRNVLAAADLLWNDKGLTVTTVSGIKVDFPDATKLSRLDFSQGKLSYLSDLDPVRAEVNLGIEDGENFAQFVRYRRDKNLENGPMRLDGTSYAKGLSLHAGAVLVYDLAGDYSSFRAVLGVDESVQTESQVEVVIEGNGRELFRGKIGRRDSPKPLALDVKGVQQLRIDVRSVGLVELGGEVSLADAKVSK
jgi:hypothetical protein